MANPSTPESPPGAPVPVGPPLIRRALRVIPYALCATWLGGAAAEPAPSSPVVARVFDKEIRLSDISPPESQPSEVRQPEPSSDYEAWLSKKRKQKLEARIWQEVTDHLLDEYHLQPTAAEVEALLSFLEAQRIGRLEKSEARLEKIRKELSTPALPADRRANLEEERAAMETLVAHELKEREKSKTVPNYEEMQRRAGARVSKVTVRDWNVNKALYEKYGGRVIFQQAGYEPIDAYRAFIDDLEKQNAVEIVDPSFPAPFSHLRAYFEIGHNYLPKEAGDQYFKKPWWLTPP